MTHAIWTPQTVGTNCELSVRITKSLLGYGVLAGPFYVVISVLQGLTRTGFDFARHPWSVLANGDLGWIQTTNLIITGLMVLAAAVGMRRLLKGGVGGTWGPGLIGAFGLSMVASGIFPADPVPGFPPHDGPVGLAIKNTVPGMLHFAFGAVGFVCFAIATFVIARRFAGLGWATYSRITGGAFLLSFGAMAAGPGVGILIFTAGVLAAFTWLATTSVRFYRGADR
ncbi:DUF998 domain-containing protein [Kibdelosporangium aridum]|uniref:DUF998 domain-containing protein n=1 Tax=Kibdelosporangium aridum TaxID=2030 RepID=A0A428ZAD5_KIBAR|nr:DUF998 domain-containing protein [Kibdelosporangium aridum]RSM85014.1 DUF998 domain-containing protein [Kibdelosporangium aridum]